MLTHHYKMLYTISAMSETPQTPCSPHCCGGARTFFPATTAVNVTAMMNQVQVQTPRTPGSPQYGALNYVNRHPSNVPRR